MAELIHPLDRELLRQNRRQTNDGFSEDRLSYSGANDFGKMWGGAMAEYDARRKSPRTDAFGKVLESDTIDSMRRELLDPIIQRFGSPNQMSPRQSAPRTYKVGNQSTGERVISVDPLTGESTEVYVGKAAPKSERQDPRDLIDYRMAASRLEEANKDLAAAEPTRRNGAVKARDEAAAALKLLRMPQPSLEPPSNPLRPDPLNEGFIGEMELGKPSGTNRFSAPDPALTKSAQSNSVPSALDGDKLVPVFRPNGTPTRIKASKFKEAIEKHGYKPR